MTITIDPSQLTLLKRAPSGENEWPFHGYKRMDHVSPSMLSKLVECPREWQQRYLLDRPERPAENLVLGTAFHAAMELNMQQKIASHEDMPLVEVVEWFDDSGFAAVVEADQEKAGTEIIWDSSFEDTKTRGRLMVGRYHSEVSPRLQPTAVEGRFSVPMGLPVPVEGRFDLLTEATAIDWKSGKQRTSKPKTSWLIQAAIYSFATSRPVEFHSVSCSLARHDVGIVTPLESEELLVDLSIAEVDALQTTIRGLVDEACYYMRRYGPDQPWPTRGRFHMFACDYCSFRDDCPAWSAA